MMPLPISGKPFPWPEPPGDHRKAAVLFLLYPAMVNDPSLSLVFIQRPEYDGTHGGQISLPGGRQERNETLAEAATRETHEEVGVDPEQVVILGQLAEFYVYASNHNVHPFVGYVAQRPAFVPCQQEVAEIIEAPLKTLLDPATRQCEQRDLKRWGATEVPYFAVGKHKIWGATAIMLAEFLHLLKDMSHE
ncbi:MAG: coenzyme A pyrophosphatase [Gammaproteobacteria bacterium]|nr:MAG: coenzyme A pyrophosphatase [Gammaproteobacteria bacterium]